MHNDYTLDYLQAVREQNDFDFYSVFTQCMEELDVLLYAKKENKIVMEDVKVEDNADKGVFAKLIDFIKRMINKFLETAQNLFKSNKTWFSDNIHKFDNIKDNAYSDIKITIVPYWKATYGQIKPSINDNNEKIWSELKTTDKLEPAMYPGLVRLSTSKNLSEGSKIQYRGGSNNLVSITGGDVKPRVKEMIEYCNGYIETTNKIKDIIEKTTTEIEKSQNEITKVNESFCYLEGLPIMETTYSTIPWFNHEGGQILLEAEAPAQQPTTTGGDKPAGSAPAGNGSVSTGGDKPAGDDTKNADAEKEKQRQDHVNKHTAVKAYWQTVLKVDTALMTIAEERYHAYIKTLKSVLSSIGNQTVNDKK